MAESSRRDFVKNSLIAGTALNMLSTCDSKTSQLNAKSVEMKNSEWVSPLMIQPRYHRWHVDVGVEWNETNTGYATLNWSIPRARVAIVLIDVWDHHYLKDTEARIESVIQQKLVPLLDVCRKEKVQIIHAPSFPIARQHRNWVSLKDATQFPNNPSDWPPIAFRVKSGIYETYRRPNEPREGELVKLRAERKLHPLVQPIGDEPVVANGDELHSYCKQNEILFLMFAGFNTNACVLLNDYGTLAMTQRGYEVIVIRDCTTGMESRETQASLAQTTGAVLFLEMFGKYSITSDEIRNGLLARTGVTAQVTDH
ncbi:MAG TPA: isochorismatase family protein [Pirellula sp.]|nr:isochorismatase family protein [Pirellula sp.]